MSTFDQLRTLVAKIADGIAGTRSLADHHRSASGGHGQCARRPDGQHDARTTPAAREDEKRAQPPSGSFPAVWPR
jgi:hypothetical protein